MKKTILLIVLVFTAFSCSKKEGIYPKEASIKVGEENTYVYSPKNDLQIPEDAMVNVFYEVFNKKSFPLNKTGSKYEFTCKVPDSIDVLLITITDKKDNPIDTNSDKGYTVYLKQDTEQELDEAKISMLNMSRAANYLLKTNIDPKETITQYETLFNKNPSLKTDKSYVSYLFLRHSIDKESTKPDMLSFAEKSIKQGDEKSLQNAYNIYATLKETEKSKAVKKQILEKYPTGQIAKWDFQSNFFKKQNKTEDYVLNQSEKYAKKFNDYSAKSKDIFYRVLLSMYVKNEDTLNIFRYEDLLSDKLMVVNIYNNHAWELSGQDLTSPGKNLQYAEMLSKKSLDIIKSELDKIEQNGYDSRLQDMYIMCADTYALILYKQKNYDLAFQYQHEIALQDKLDTGGKERYAGFAEKVKGPEFAKDFIEKQIFDGVDSRILLNQLENIYKTLNLPISKFEKIKNKSLKLSQLKIKEDIINKYGSTKAIDFALTNLEENKIKLSDYKGKVVVLDFWATWCSPCRASFPKMQELVNAYKNKEVEFFFIDTWENDKPEAIKTKVEKFIKDNNYSFNVLFDYTDEVVAKYKVEGIPAKFVINKEGSIISVNSSDDNLKALIDENI